MILLRSIFVKVKVEKSNEFIIMLLMRERISVVLLLFVKSVLKEKRMVLMKDVKVKIKRIGNNKERIIVKYSNGNSFSFIACKKVKRE